MRDYLDVIILGVLATLSYAAFLLVYNSNISSVIRNSIAFGAAFAITSLIIRRKSTKEERTLLIKYRRNHRESLFGISGKQEKILSLRNEIIDLLGQQDTDQLFSR